MPPGNVRLAVLRQLAESLVELVLDADLRGPREVAGLPAAPCRGGGLRGCAAPATSSRSPSAGSAAVTAALSRPLWESPRRPRCWRGSWWEARSRRTAASRRTSSGCLPLRARSGRRGSAFPPGARRRGSGSTGKRTARSPSCPPASRSRSRSSGRARSEARSSASPRSTASGPTSSSTPGGSPQVRTDPVRGGSAFVGSAGFPMSPDCGSSRSAPRRCARVSSSEISSHRPTTRSRMPRSLPRSPSPTGITAPAPGPLVVAEGVAGLVASPVLARSYRSYSWV